jgi:hypothetical protein
VGTPSVSKKPGPTRVSFKIRGPDSLLYVGRTTEQTFAGRLEQHLRYWLREEIDCSVYVGRIYDHNRHVPANEWKEWVQDVCLAEQILIYKYSPHYNSVSISEPPRLSPWHSVTLHHTGEYHRLDEIDWAPNDWL